MLPWFALCGYVLGRGGAKLMSARKWRPLHKSGVLRVSNEFLKDSITIFMFPTCAIVNISKQRLCS